MKPEELSQTLSIMIKDTTEGKMNWKLDIQTTEGKAEKCQVEEDGVIWMVDECFASFACSYRKTDFCIITYEMIKQSGDQTKTINYVFLPAVGVRVFSLHTLLPHSIEAGQTLISQIHTLFTLLMQSAKDNSGNTVLRITEASVTIEDDLM